MIAQDCRHRSLRSPAMWHPWRTLRGMPDVTVHLRRDLPVGVRAATDGQQILMSSRLLQRERRAALAHELEHIRHCRVVDCTHRDEVFIRQAAARRLIDIEQLAKALVWTQDVDELAEELWVDVDTVRTRLEHLHPAERLHLRRRLAERDGEDTG